MRNLGFALVVMFLSGYLALAIIRPQIVLGWVKRGHPEYSGDDGPILLAIRLVGIVGFIVMLCFGLFVARTLERG